MGYFPKRDNINQFRFATGTTILLLAMLACSLPGTSDKAQPPSDAYAQTAEHTAEPASTQYNYVQLDITNAPPPIMSTDLPTRTSTPADKVVIIESSATPIRQTIVITSENFFRYSIRRGDNFARLARRFCGDEKLYLRLLVINGMEEGETLRIGQEVIIDCGG